MKQQLIQEFYRRQKKKTWLILDRPTLKYGEFLWKYKDKDFFCRHNILTEDVSVTQLSNNAGILVWWVAGVTAICCFMSE